MLTSIKITNCFAHPNSTFDFADGMTAITGLNGSGKSQILEMVRFALFGSSALRTVAEDYKGAKVVLAFHVRDVAYRVERTTGSAKLFRGSELLCSGTRPVNNKVVEIFGYGLDVFDVANVANQGAIEALSSMRPAERKRLIDTTVGLNLLDELAKWCGEEAASRGREAQAIGTVLVAPTVPEKPEGYRPAVELRVEHAEAVAQADEYRLLAARIVSTPPDYKEPTAFTKDLQSLEVLEGIDRSRRTVTRHIADLKRSLDAIPHVAVTSEDVDQWQITLDNWQAHKSALEFKKSFIDTAKMTIEQLDELDKLITDQHSYARWEKLVSAGSHTCPKCSHSWPIKANEIEEDWTEREPPRKTSVTRAVLNELYARRHSLDARAEEAAQARIVIAAHGDTLRPSPPLAGAIAAARQALAREPERQSLVTALSAAEAELAAFPGDLGNRLDERTALDRAHAVWRGVQEARSQLSAWEARSAAIAGSVEAAGRLGHLVTEATIYERMTTEYARLRVLYDEGVVRLAALDAERAEYQKARGALAEIKVKVKTHLVPSLSRVSTGLLRQMTNGAFSEIIVSEDFDISVDGVSVDGLSGAGKAATNLALRIGLGQVLTNKVFSVVMLDEPDMSMDADRSEAFASCIRKLSASIKQIVLVSHKRPDADHYIAL